LALTFLGQDLPPKRPLLFAGNCAPIPWGGKPAIFELPGLKLSPGGEGGVIRGGEEESFEGVSGAQ